MLSTMTEVGNPPGELGPGNGRGGIRTARARRIASLVQVMLGLWVALGMVHLQMRVWHLVGEAGIPVSRVGFEPDMTVELSDALKKLVDTTNVYATLATLGRTGDSHLTVIWIDRDGDDLLYSTTVARQQYKNVVRDPRVTIMILAPDNPFSYAEIRGTATVAPDPAREFPDRLSLKYTGKPYAEFNPASAKDADRVIVRVTPDKVRGLL